MGKTARREGYAGVVERCYKEQRYSDRLNMNGVVLRDVSRRDRPVRARHQHQLCDGVFPYLYLPSKIIRAPCNHILAQTPLIPSGWWARLPHHIACLYHPSLLNSETVMWKGASHSVQTSTFLLGPNANPTAVGCER